MSNELIELRYGLDSFRTDWRHCSLGSDFLADTAFRTQQAKQLASTAINEVLELAFRLGAKASKSWVQATVNPGQMMTLALDLKIKPEHAAEIAHEVPLFLSDPVAYYETQLGQNSPGIFFGLGYLVADIQAVVTLVLENDMLLVRANLPLCIAGLENLQ